MAGRIRAAIDYTDGELAGECSVFSFLSCLFWLWRSLYLWKIATRFIVVDTLLQIYRIINKHNQRFDGSILDKYRRLTISLLETSWLKKLSPISIWRFGRSWNTILYYWLSRCATISISLWRAASNAQVDALFREENHELNQTLEAATELLDDDSDVQIVSVEFCDESSNLLIFVEPSTDFLEFIHRCFIFSVESPKGYDVVMPWYEGSCCCCFS